MKARPVEEALQVASLFNVKRSPLDLLEVDPDLPVGMTGNSGGGTQTTFLMPLDDRIGPAAPSCYLMTQERKFITRTGPADGCQHLPCEGARGIDHADYIFMRAPRPTRVLAANQDYFDINAVREAKRLAKERQTFVSQQIAERAKLQKKVKSLVDQRQAYIQKELKKNAAKAKGSFSQKVYDSVRRQAAERDIHYESVDALH